MPDPSPLSVAWARRRVACAAGAVLTVAVSLSFGQDGAAAEAEAVCSQAPRNVSCSDGAGRRTPGGHGKVSHRGWPALTGVLMQAGHGGHRFRGGPANDGLYGGHGDDTITGGPGRDVLWGDQWPTGNTARQADVLFGGPGNDFLYPSHGHNTLRGGRGNDRIIAYYGHGTIDCGPGPRDYAQVRITGAYRVRNCEHVRHFCAHGSTKDGRCLSPGGTPVSVAVLRPARPAGTVLQGG